MLTSTGCDNRVYVRDGVTDGDRFSLPGYVYVDSDPILQSWVAYSLTRSVCQLEIGGENPARNSSFDCERISREALVERWTDLGGVPVVTPDAEVAQSPGAQYLDELRAVSGAGFLGEYVWVYFESPDWQQPPDLALREFGRWRDENIGRRHKPRTQIVGSWGYIEPDSTD